MKSKNNDKFIILKKNQFNKFIRLASIRGQLRRFVEAEVSEGFEISEEFENALNRFCELIDMEISYVVCEKAEYRD